MPLSHEALMVKLQYECLAHPWIYTQHMFIRSGHCFVIGSARQGISRMVARVSNVDCCDTTTNISNRTTLGDGNGAACACNINCVSDIVVGQLQRATL